MSTAYLKTMPWSSFQERVKLEVGTTMDRLDEFINHLGIADPCHWNSIGAWESMSDEELISFFANLPKDALTVISDVCYLQKTGPFCVESTNTLNEFAAQYYQAFGESLFNGDVIMISWPSSYLGVFHHEGIYFEGSLKKQGSG